MANQEPRHRPAGEAEIVVAPEELDAYTTPAFRDLVFGLISQQGRCKLVIDLQHTRFIDSMGLGVIAGALRRTRDQDGWVSVACTYEPVLKQFRLVGLPRILGIHDSVDDALAAHGIDPGEAAQLCTRGLSASRRAPQPRTSLKPNWPSSATSRPSGGAASTKRTGGGAR